MSWPRNHAARALLHKSLVHDVAMTSSSAVLPHGFILPSRVRRSSFEDCSRSILRFRPPSTSRSGLYFVSKHAYPALSGRRGPVVTPPSTQEFASRRDGRSSTRSCFGVSDWALRVNAPLLDSAAERTPSFSRPRTLWHRVDSWSREASRSLGDRALRSWTGEAISGCGSRLSFM